MAETTVTTLTDDLDPDTEATSTKSFGLDGASYDIDLSDEHTTQLHEALQPYLAAARRTSGPRTTRTTRSRTASSRTPAARPKAAAGDGSGPAAQTPAPAAVRAWAREHDFADNDRGRLKGPSSRSSSRPSRAALPSAGPSACLGR